MNEELAIKQTDPFGWSSHNKVSMVKCIPHCKYLKNEVLKYNPRVTWELPVLLEIVGALLPFVMFVFQEEYNWYVCEKSLKKNDRLDWKKKNKTD